MLHRFSITTILFLFLTASFRCLGQDCKPSLLNTFTPEGTTQSAIRSFFNVVQLNNDVLVCSNLLSKQLEVFKLSPSGFATKVQKINYNASIPYEIKFQGDTIELSYLNELIGLPNGNKLLKNKDLFISISNSKYKKDNGAILYYKKTNGEYVLQDTIFATIPKENGRLYASAFENNKLFALESFPRKFHVFEFKNGVWEDSEFSFNNGFISNFIAKQDTVFVSIRNYYGVNKGNIIKLVYENGSWIQTPLSNVSIDNLIEIIQTGDDFISFPTLMQVKKKTAMAWEGIPISPDLISPSTTSYNTWAQSVVANNNYLAVSDNTYSEKGENAGAVVIYTRDASNAWKARSVLYPDLIDAPLSYGMGQSVKTYQGNVLTSVSTHKDSTGTSNAVYLYEKGENGYISTVFKAGFDDIYQQYGTSLDLDGDLVVIGCPGCKNQSGQVRGAVFIHKRDNMGVWQITKLEEPSGTNLAAFGSEVEIYNDRIFITSLSVNGSIVGDGGVNGYYGRLYDFKKINNQWKAKTYLLENSINGETFASKIAASDDILSVVNTNSEGYGKIIFYNIGDTLSKLHEKSIDDPFAHQWGRALDFKNKRAIVSAPLASTSTKFGRGKIFIFDLNENGITQQEYIPTHLPENTNGNYGLSLALKDEDIVSQNYLSGHIELIKRVNNTWVLDQNIIEVFPSNKSIDINDGYIAVGNGSDGPYATKSGTVKLYSNSSRPVAICKDTSVIFYNNTLLQIDPKWIDGGSSYCGNHLISVVPEYISVDDLGFTDINFTVTVGTEISTCTARIDVQKDLDNDGFTNIDDCDDTNAAINPNTIWLADADGDGFTVTAESKKQCEKPAGYILNSLSLGDDCDDTNAAINPNTIWLADTDGDGYVVTNDSKTQCEKPDGYILTSSSKGEDCDDSDAAINPETVWTVDADGDGYTVNTDTKTQCEKPSGYILQSLSLGDDCDDTNAEINPNTTWLADSDGDGFTVATESKTQCEKPSGYIIQSSSLGDDCDDTNAEINPNTTWLADADGDGFTVTAESKTQCEKPTGYILQSSSLGDDCDDTNAEINPNTVWLADADSDDYVVTDDSKTQCEKPSGYILQSSSLGDDCDDTNAEINPNTTWLADADGDGYVVTDDSKTQCERPDGYILASSSKGEDCDDSDAAINPGVEEIPGNDVDEDCDGNILSSTKNVLNKRFLFIFPNPVTNNLNLVCHMNNSIQIINSKGQVFGHFELNEGSNTIDVSDLQQGFYYIKDLYNTVLKFGKM